jgi:Catalase
VHARGAAAHGVFESYGTAKSVTEAGFLGKKGTKTDVFTGFSTMLGSRGRPTRSVTPEGSRSSSSAQHNCANCPTRQGSEADCGGLGTTFDVAARRRDCPAHVRMGRLAS